MGKRRLDPQTQAIRDALTTRRLGNDSNELLVQIMETWGGPAEFARNMWVEFEAAKPGSLIRQNILEMIQKLVVNNTNHNITQVVDPADLDDEDIDRELDSMLARAKEHAVAAATPEPTTSEQPAWEWNDRAAE
jgi:hypothetical protein